MPAFDAIELDLVTAAIVSQFNGVQVDLPPVGVMEGDCSGEPIPDNLEPVGHKDASEPLDGSGIDDEVEIGVIPRLLVEQRIDTPPAVNPGRDALGGQPLKDGKHLIAVHEHIVTSYAARLPASVRYRPHPASLGDAVFGSRRQRDRHRVHWGRGVVGVTVLAEGALFRVALGRLVAAVMMRKHGWLWPGRRR